MDKRYILFLIISLLLSTYLVSADILPQAYRGFIRFNQTVLDEGYVITASTNQYISSSSDIVDGYYDLVVYGNEGQIVSFFINGKDTGQKETFGPLEVTDLDINLNDLSKNKNFCGDKVCKEYECSYCEIDCGACYYKENNIPIISNEDKIDYEFNKSNDVIGEIEEIKLNRITGLAVAIEKSDSYYGWIIILTILVLVLLWDLKKKEAKSR